MELKVWVDGVQRVVCGVTEATTCQEVVIALAQAIGRSQTNHSRLLHPRSASYSNHLIEFFNNIIILFSTSLLALKLFDSFAFLMGNK